VDAPYRTSAKELQVRRVHRSRPASGALATAPGALTSACVAETPPGGSRAATRAWGPEQGDWLLRTMTAMVQCRTVAALLALASAAIRTGLGYDRVGIDLVDPLLGAVVASLSTDGQGHTSSPQGRVAPLDAAEYTAHVLTDPRLRSDGPGFIYRADVPRETPHVDRALVDVQPTDLLVVALRTGGTVLGALSVDNRVSGRSITPAHAAVLVTFATGLAATVESVRLLEGHAQRLATLQGDLQRRMAALEWLRDVSRRITEAGTRAAVLEVVYHGVRDGLGYDRVGINLFDHEAGVFEDCIGTDALGGITRPMDRTVDLAPDSAIWRLPGIAALLRGAEFYYTTDAHAECPPELHYLFDGAPTHNLMIPLRTADRATGMISVDNLPSGRPISPADAGPLLALANQVGTAVENARLLERERAERARLHQMATTDALTGLPTRALLRARLEHGLADAERAAPLALLLLDLNRFKEVNDTLGHHIGDGLLTAVATRLQEVVRRDDMVARLGGDEFAIVRTEGDTDGALAVARAICAALEAPFTVEGHAVSVGVSVGVAFCPVHGDDAGTLLRHADAAMYAAKQGGLGHAVYDPGQDDYDATRLGRVGDLRQAIAAGTLVLHYQPKVALETGRVCGVEALVRWPHPTYGLLPPERFIPLAEQTGLIVPLTAWVLNEALRQRAAWAAAGVAVAVAVNLSVRNVRDPQLCDMVAATLARHAAPAACLCLELTETVMMADAERALDVLTRLAALGVRLAVDDFGSGYSSLAYLKKLPVHELKMDKGFVRELATDAMDAAIVASTVALGHALGLRVVAEGIEDRVTWDQLKAMGCDVAQGYYLSRPLTADALGRWLRDSPWAGA